VGSAKAAPAERCLATGSMRVISDRQKAQILKFCVASFAVYALCNLGAMLLYGGGTSSDPSARGYTFSQNFFSDLGMVRAYSGQPNTSSLLLFASALLLMGMALISFFAIMPGYFTGSRLARTASRVGSFAGVVAGLCCAGIAATPWDLFLSAHLKFVYVLSASFLCSMLGYFVAILANRDYPNRHAILFAVYAVILGAYVGLMLLGPDIHTREGLTLLAAGQKVVIYAGMLCWFLQFLGAYRYHLRHYLWDHRPLAQDGPPRF